MHFLVDFFNDITPEQVQEYFQTNNCTVLKQFNHWNNVYHVEATVEPPKTDIIESIVNDTESTMQLLNATTLSSSTDTYNVDIQDDKNWWKIASFWDVDFSSPQINNHLYGEHVSVYIMDSGIDHTHPEFVGRDIELFHSFDGTFDDLSGHGTAIASLISGNTCGLTNAKLKIVKILNEGQITSLSQLLTAFDAIIADLPNSHYAVVNMSWGVPRNEYLDAKIKSMVRQNFSMVAAAGNNGGPIENLTPAALNEVITIGAYNENFEPCDFSAYTGSEVSVTNNTVNTGELDGWAPGQNLWVARPGGGYGMVAGTSFSAAIHSGALAYLIDLDFCTSDGEIVPCLSSGALDLAWAGALSRQNILNLTGDYTASVNKISTYACNTSHNTALAVFPEKVQMYANEMFCMMLVSRKEVSNIEFDHPLPNGMKLADNGYLYGTPTLGENDPDYVIENYTVTLTLLNGETKIMPLALAWRKQDMDLSTVPPNDSWIIQVMGILCGPNFTCNKRCPGPANNPAILCCQPKVDFVCELCLPFAACI